MGDGERVLRVFNAAAQHRVDVHVKLGMLCQELQFFVQDLQALLGDLIGLHVIDADLKMFQARPVQPLNAVGGEQVSIGNHPGENAVLAYAGDNGVEIGMQQRLAAADGDE